MKDVLKKRGVNDRNNRMFGGSIMGLPGQEFLRKFEDYTKKIHMGQYLEQHALDPRNSDPIETRIQLDVDSRKYVEYLKELILMCNQVRNDNGLELLPK